MTNINYEIADRLFTVYRYQNIYSDLIEKITNGFIMGEFNTLKDWWLVFALLAQNGEFAPRRYPGLLKLLKEEYDLSIPVDSTKNRQAASDSLANPDSLK